MDGFKPEARRKNIPIQRHLGQMLSTAVAGQEVEMHLEQEDRKRKKGREGGRS